MTVCGFVGCIDEDESEIPITGTGKTLSMVGYAYQDFLNNWVVWSNFKTTFSDKVIGIQKMIDLIQTEINKDNVIDFNLLLLITEIQDVLDAIGSKQKEILFIDYFLRQMRKVGEDKGQINFFWDNQRLMSIQKRLRIHTNRIFIPFKTHMNNQSCLNPKCKDIHKIYVYSHKPFIDYPIKCFNAPVVGKKYNQYEIVHDVLKIPTKKEMMEND